MSNGVPRQILCEVYEPDEISHKKMMLDAVSAPEILPGHCIFCNQKGHPPLRCQLNPTERLMVVYDAYRCEKCLQRAHRSVDCWERSCEICEGDHHISLCVQLESRHGWNIVPRVLREKRRNLRTQTEVAGSTGRSKENKFRHKNIF